MENIRIGKVSSIDYENGMITVVYENYNNAVSNKMPILSFNDEYKMPKIGDEIIVLKLSNETYTGIALGCFWNNLHKPPVADKNIFLKDFGHIPLEAYLSYNEDNKTLTIHAPKIVFEEENSDA